MPGSDAYEAMPRADQEKRRMLEMEGKAKEKNPNYSVSTVGYCSQYTS